MLKEAALYGVKVGSIYGITAFVMGFAMRALLSDED